MLDAARPRLVVAMPGFFDAHAQLRVRAAAEESTNAAGANDRAKSAAASVSAAGANDLANLPAAWWKEESPADFSDADHAGARLDVVPVDDNAPAIILFTSGTTGAPKSVPLSHANLRANLKALAAVWQRSSDDRLLHILPAHHFHGLVLGIYGSLLAANTVLLMPGFDAAATLAAIPALDANLVMGVPTMYARLLEHGATAASFSGVRLAISGSAPLPAALWTAFHNRCGIALVNRYGLTETGIVTSTHPHTTRAGTVGTPLAGTEVFICDEDGRYHCAAGVNRSDSKEAADLNRGESRDGGDINRDDSSDAADVNRGESRDGGDIVHCAAGVRGEICVRGPSVTAGYGNAPEANAQSFRNGFFHTGDLGHFDDHGDLYVEGRLKELTIVGGSNVVPGEVEAPLSTVDGVAEVVVTGAAHRDLGEIVVAWIVAAAASTDTARLERDLRAHAERNLAPYKRPRTYYFLDAIPRNAMGKVDRKRLTALDA